MARPFIVTFLKPDGTAWSGGKFTISLREGFAGVDEAVSPYTIEYTLDSNGQIATQPIALETPPTGTAHYLFGEPGGENTEAYIESGSAVDYSTLKTVAGGAVDQDAAQTLFDQANIITPTTVTSGPYTVQADDRYIRVSGTITINLRAAALSKTPLIIYNYGTGNVTVLPAGSDTIAGAASWPIYPGQAWGFVDAVAGIWDAL